MPEFACGRSLNDELLLAHPPSTISDVVSFSLKLDTSFFHRNNKNFNGRVIKQNFYFEQKGKIFFNPKWRHIKNNDHKMRFLRRTIPKSIWWAFT